ncbi:HAD family hydrolase [Cohnella nanjingensis]|uniref:HAD family hydrolase n=1 Tax=Cohnella nanjingensis TaxID=1387779 RepID=A0A7X0VHI8_9BACL|nr:HAD family hydrolase [Cohnella nanjingensis]MBB6673523.1 HAD family hydrolase [Cohnella nanjingensis]
MPKAILFDLDGTLLDRDRSLLDFVRAQYDRISAFRHVDKPAFVRRFIELDAKGYVWKDRVYQSLLSEFQADHSWEALLEDYIDGFRHHCVGFPGLHEMLGHLRDKGLKLAIITNGYTRFQENNIMALQLPPYFDEIVVSEREGVRKPDPEIFHRALRRLNVTPGEAVYVGDHPANDIRAARQAGMRAVWKEDAYYAKPDEANWTIRQLSEISALADHLLP